MREAAETGPMAFNVPNAECGGDARISDVALSEAMSAEVLPRL